MKKLLIGLLALGSLSAFAAETRYECSSPKGEIIVTTDDNGEATIDFSKHPVTKEDYFSIAYFDILKDPLTNFQNDKLTISNELVKDDAYRMKFKNTPTLLIANANGGADFSSSSIKFRFNKKTLRAHLSYRVSAWLVRYGSMKDTFKCK